MLLKQLAGKLFDSFANQGALVDSLSTPEALDAHLFEFHHEVRREVERGLDQLGYWSTSILGNSLTIMLVSEEGVGTHAAH
jgi:hypothetical protein